jgi:Uma2 family endonuclease
MSAIPTYPHRHAVTAQEFLRMAAADVFATDMRLELMEGEIIEMPPTGSAHAAVVNSLAAIMNDACGKQVIVSVQNPIIVGDQSVPQPDLALLRTREDKYFHQHPTPADVLLVTEVSDTTLRFDLEKKASLYAAAGIPETWVIDVEQRVLHALRAATPSGYLRKSVIDASGTITASAVPRASVAVNAIFP